MSEYLDRMEAKQMELIKDAVRKNKRFSEVSLWDKMRLLQQASYKNRLSALLNIKSSNTTCAALCADVCADVFGLLQNGEQVQPTDAADASLRTHLMYINTAEVDAANHMLAIASSHALHKLLRYESTQQISLLHRTIEHLSPLRLQQVRNPIAEYQGICAMLHANVQIDLDTKKPEEYSPNLPKIAAEFMVLDRLNIPYID